MKLIDLQVKKYLDLLKSDAPAPGGGSVSALAGAQAAALMMMVADLTLGKEKYAAEEEICKAARAEAAHLYAALTEAVDRDTEAFNKVAAAFKMSKATDEEKAHRREAIRQGTWASTEVPYGVMALALRGLRGAKTLVGHSNPNTASDLGVAALQLMSAMEGAWLNVKINLPGLKDEAAVARFTERGEAMLQEGKILTEKIYEEVVRSL